MWLNIICKIRLKTILLDKMVIKVILQLLYPNQEGNKKYFFNVRYMAVCARGEKPAIFIFDTMNHKRKKTLLGD